MIPEDNKEPKVDPPAEFWEKQPLTLEDHFIKCPHCGYQSGVDPALLQNEDPMPYCNECDKPLLI
jgi:hypothetical protein